LFIWEVPKEPGQETSQGPTLFAKEDYKIDEREDGKYIVVEKVGLTCKVPENWDIKIKRTPDIEPQYWIDLYSPDMATTTNDILINGCRMSITVGIQEGNNKEIKNNINTLKENPNTIPEDISYIYKDYLFQVIKINDCDTLRWISPEYPTIGQVFGIDIPIENTKLIDITIAFPAKYKEKCSTIWEEFIKNIIIE
jgi:hypothetical protein